MTFSPVVATIGYDPVLYTVSETAGTVAVNISLLQGDLTGLMASAAILVNVSAESFTATGLSVCLSVCLCLVSNALGGGFNSNFYCDVGRYLGIGGLA